jgi:hypothetical protein
MGGGRLWAAEIVKRGLRRPRAGQENYSPDIDEF